MGFCSAAGEGDMEEDSGDVVAAAMWDDFLAAKLLFCLSRPEAAVPMKQAALAPRLRPSNELAWRKKGSRSRTITREGTRAAQREDGRRPSPTTPLSWSGDASGTSGSVCSGRAGSQRRKRRRACESDETGKVPEEKRIRVPSGEGTNPEPAEDGEPAANTFGAACCFLSNKEVAAAAAAVGERAAAEAPVYVEPLRWRPAVDEAGPSVVGRQWKNKVAREPAAAVPPACAEPLRWRSAAEGPGPLVIGRRGKKKTLTELRSMTESLSQEQAWLRKELERHRAIYDALLEENTNLKKMETISDPGHVACEEIKKPVQSQHVTSTRGSPAASSFSPCPSPAAPEQVQGGGESTSAAAPRPPIFLFDLNCTPPPDEDESLY